MQLSIEELAMLLGQKYMELYSMQKQLQAALARIAELEKEPEPDDSKEP